MRIILPWPPSVNHAFATVGRRRVLSQAGRDYRDSVAKRVLMDHWQNAFGLHDEITAKIAVHPPDKRRRDLDNLLKSVLDALQKAGVYPDDSQIVNLSIEKGAVDYPLGSIEVELAAVAFCAAGRVRCHTV